MKWRYLVRYRNGVHLKDKDFGMDLEAAREFHEKCKKYGNGSVLTKYKAHTWLDKTKEAEVTWRGHRAKLTDVLICAFALVSIIALWRKTS